MCEERSARWLEVKLERPLSWMLVKLKREPIGNAGGKAVELRPERSPSYARGRGWASIGVVGDLFLTYLILLTALRFVGVPAAELSAPEAFVAFAVGFWAGAVFPITGSGLGWSMRC